MTLSNTLSNKLMSQLRTAARSLLRRPPTARQCVIHESIEPAAASPPAPVTGHSKNMHKTTSQRSAYDPFSSMLADLGRLGQLGANPFLFPVFGAAPSLPGHVIDAAYTNDAGSRDYKLYVPSSYTGRAAPLLVMLHGCAQSADDFALGTGMNALAEESGCLVAYPAQSQHANASRCWNWYNAVDQQHGQGEPSIIAGITRDIMARYAVDARQVYVAGLSAGGAMAAILGTLYPELYAAVGVHSGLPFAAAHDLSSAFAAMKGDVRRRQGPARAVPIIVFHGDRDTTVHPVNGDELMHQRRRHPREATVVEPGQVPDGHAYTRTVHRRPDGSIHAEHWLVHGSGHAWSGGDARGSYTDDRGPSASQEMMRFFRTAR